MPRSHAHRMGVAIVLSLAGLVLAVHACSEQPTEITDPQAREANAAVGKSTLTLAGAGSTASGTLVSNRGGMTCAVTFSPSGVTLSGACSKSFKTGTVLLIKANPPANGGTVTWANCDPVVTDDPLTCKVTLNTNKTINARFAPPPSTYMLTVQGGAGGSGSVQSGPSGISCVITNGLTGSGCTAAFGPSTSVTLSASAGTANYIKAWAGGGCENAGTGVGGSSGTCTLVMTQAQTVVVSFEADANEYAVGKWAAPIGWPHVAIHSHLLPNGQVMSYGRMHSTPVSWNPVSGMFTNLPLPADFFCSGHAFLPDGRLIVTGGHSGTDNYGIKTTYLFDFALNQWTRGVDMRNGRWYPTVTTLGNGEVLTISGGDTSAVVNDLAEVYQSNGTWRALTGARKAVPYYPMMFAGPDGRVAMVGPGRQTWYLSTTSTGGWTAGPLTIFIGGRDYGSAVMYDAGKILLLGGNSTPTATAEVIDLNAGSAASWRNVQAMSVARRQLNATLLADGTVLVTGGSNASGFNNPPTDSRVLTAERWNPDTETWSSLGRMTHQRLYHSAALLLLDGRVISVGSGEPAASGQPNDLSAETFSPPYLWNRDGTPATRPAITDAPVSVTYGQAFTVATPNAASIAKVTFIRLSSVTHSFNQNQRMNRLSFSATASGLTVVAPPNGNHAPPGHYMLFIVDSNGVPSEGKIIRIF
jgi:Galactose oxidase-like, Early set domain/Kelch motif